VRHFPDRASLVIHVSAFEISLRGFDEGESVKDTKICRLRFGLLKSQLGVEAP
jgi:hypothetical protein